MEDATVSSAPYARRPLGGHSGQVRLAMRFIQIIGGDLPTGSLRRVLCFRVRESLAERIGRRQACACRFLEGFIEKAGMEREGLMRHHLLLRGRGGFCPFMLASPTSPCPDLLSRSAPGFATPCLRAFRSSRPPSSTMTPSVCAHPCWLDGSQGRGHF